eukprot:TRINITY_DN1397_c0_g1_i1.p1 TRINITY_DN1397_c0_g1~~TRINITY_DN1397_c0_g1_i1.p1  ORF type:complete len:348 (-),score=66.71 TRINITY_DN1397_c0_g1_i1:218-1261(-)
MSDIDLLEDHRCEPSVPSVTIHALRQHTDECWFVQYSHSGQMIVTTSKDCTAILWDASSGKVLWVLYGHIDGVSSAAFSPDDTTLLTTSSDSLIKLWDTKTGDCIRTYSHHSGPVVSASWLPDGHRFVSGGSDRSIFLTKLDGAVVKKWKSTQANDLIVTPDGMQIIAGCQEKKIKILSINDDTIHTLDETDPMMSLALSSDGRYLIASSIYPSQEIHLWNLRSKTLIFKYRGHFQSRFAIRACFGGPNDSLVASGSEDSKIYIWHRRQGSLLGAISGHTATVNSIAWNPSNPSQFASASDDFTVRIWATRESLKNHPMDASSDDIPHNTLTDQDGYWSWRSFRSWA